MSATQIMLAFIALRPNSVLRAVGHVVPDFGQPHRNRDRILPSRSSSTYHLSAFPCQCHGTVREEGGFMVTMTVIWVIIHTSRYSLD